MNQIRRVLAWTGIVLLVLMYVLTFVFSLFKSDLAQVLFRASLGCTILIPVLLYLFFMVAKAVRPDKSPIIDCVVFDIGNVLVDFQWEERARELHFSDESIELIRSKIVTSPLWRDFDLSIRPFDEVTDELAQTAPEYEKEIRGFVDFMDECFMPFWYTPDLIRNLHRKGYKVYFLSNWSEHSFRNLSENGILDFIRLMDGGIWSYEIHAVKPDREIYDALAKKYGLDPKRSVFIDDSEKNVRGAREAGYAAIHFTEYNDMMEKLESVGVKL